MDSGFENSDFPAETGSLVEGATSDVVSERGGIVTARGTGEGLVIRLDGRIEKATLLRALSEFLTARRTFLGGQEVSLDWIGGVPADAVVQSVEELLSEDFGIRVIASRSASAAIPQSPPQSSAVARSLFDGAKSLGVARNDTDSPFLGGGLGFSGGSVGQSLARAGQPTQRDNLARSPRAADGFEWDDPDARLVHATLRSGQKIESEHSVVVFGDVNSGAEIVAGGDIIVLGSLRGVAHAGAYDETGAGRVIFALNLQPTQLRIGAIISRGTVDVSRSAGELSNFPEIAKVEGALITVEPYVSKGSMSNRFRK